MASDKANSVAQTKDEKHEHQSTNSEDDELSELLDDALKDFGTTSKEKNQESFNSATASGSGDKWENEFAKFQDDLMKTLAEDEKSGNTENNELDKLLKEIDFSAVDDSELMSTFTKSMEGLTKDLKNVTNPSSEDELQKLQEAINMLGQNANISKDSTSSTSNAFGNAKEGNFDSSSVFGIMPLMQNVLKNLLSEDLLHGPLKEIADRYPDWLAENKMKLEDKEFNKYETQFLLMKKVCEEFELESDTDSEEVKSSRFERIVNYMQQMQASGQPPKELVQNIEYPISENGLPNFDSFNPSEKCSVM